MDDGSLPCQCKGPGFCERFGIEQTDYAWRVCSNQCTPEHPCSEQTSLRYRQKWARQKYGKPLPAHVRKGGEPTEPSLTTKIVNAGKALGRVVTQMVRRKPVMVPLEIAEQRQAICRENTCGKYKESTDTCTHKKCGCSIGRKLVAGNITRPGKTELSTEQCPLGYWGCWEPPGENDGNSG